MTFKEQEQKLEEARLKSLLGSHYDPNYYTNNEHTGSTLGEAKDDKKYGQRHNHSADSK